MSATGASCGSSVLSLSKYNQTPSHFSLATMEALPEISTVALIWFSTLNLLKSDARSTSLSHEGYLLLAVCRIDAESKLARTGNLVAASL